MKKLLSPVQVCINRFTLKVDALPDSAADFELSGYQLSPSLSSPSSQTIRNTGRNLLFLHGYGGCKEEMLGLALKTTEALAATGYIVDLPGHGKSEGIFSAFTAEACMAVLQREITPDAIIGHSIGARMAMSMPGPKAVVAVAPPLRPELEGDRQKLLRTLRQKRVREDAPFSGLVTVMEQLGEELPRPVLSGRQKLLLLRASSDIATVNDAFDHWKSHAEVIAHPAIMNSSHLDILTAPATAAAIVRHLAEWL